MNWTFITNIILIIYGAAFIIGILTQDLYSNWREYLDNNFKRILFTFFLGALIGKAAYSFLFKNRISNKITTKGKYIKGTNIKVNINNQWNNIVDISASCKVEDLSETPYGTKLSEFLYGKEEKE